MMVLIVLLITRHIPGVITSGGFTFPCVLSRVIRIILLQINKVGLHTVMTVVISSCTDHCLITTERPDMNLMFLTVMHICVLYILMRNYVWALSLWVSVEPLVMKIEFKLYGLNVKVFKKLKACYCSAVQLQ